MPSTIGSRIKEARSKAGLTQVALANAVHAHKFTVSKWERGETAPGKPSDYVAIAKVCDVAIPWLKDSDGSVNDSYVPPVEEGRRLRENRMLSSSTHGTGHAISMATGSGKTDWGLVAYMATKLLQMEPGIGAERLGRVMELGYAMAARGPLDDELLATILKAVA